MDSYEYKDGRKAFEDAIAKGILNLDEKSSMYAGNWMYMHTEVKGDAFKNIMTRKYIFIK